MTASPFLLTTRSHEVGRLDGSLADQLVCFHRPQLPPGAGFFCDVLKADPLEALTTPILITNPAYSRQEALFAPPLRFELAFEADVFGGSSPLRLWYPVAPEGFVAMGFCASMGTEPPEHLLCIRAEFTRRPTEEDVNQFAFLTVRCPGVQSLSLIRTGYMSFGLNGSIPLFTEDFLYMLQYSEIETRYSEISAAFGLMIKPKSKRLDTEAGYSLTRVPLFKNGDNAQGGRPNMSKSTMGFSFQVPGSMLMGSRLASTCASEPGGGLELDEDLMNAYFTHPNHEASFGECISSKHIVYPILPGDARLMDLTTLRATENETEARVTIAELEPDPKSKELDQASSTESTPDITTFTLADLFAPCVGFRLVAVMPTSFTEKSQRSEDASTRDESSVTAPRPLRTDDVLYTYYYEPVPPEGYVALSLVLGDTETGDPPTHQVMTLNQKFVTYTTAASVIGELYDKASAEYCYRYYQLRREMIEERRQLVEENSDGSSLRSSPKHLTMQELDKLVQPEVRPVQLVTPRGSPFILVREVEEVVLDGVAITRPRKTQFPIILPGIMAQIIAPPTPKEFLAMMSAERSTQTIVEYEGRVILEPRLRKPVYAMFGSCMRTINQTAGEGGGEGEREGEGNGGDEDAGKKTETIPHSHMVAKNAGFDCCAFAEPEDLLLVWRDGDLSLYEMIPPAGYVSLGNVFSNGPVDKSRYCCVLERFATLCEAAPLCDLPQTLDTDACSLTYSPQSPEGYVNTSPKAVWLLRGKGLQAYAPDPEPEVSAAQLVELNKEEAKYCSIAGYVTVIDPEYQIFSTEKRDDLISLTPGPLPQEYALARSVERVGTSTLEGERYDFWRVVPPPGFTSGDLVVPEGVGVERVVCTREVTKEEPPEEMVRGNDLLLAKADRLRRQFDFPEVFHEDGELLVVVDGSRLRIL